MATAVEDFRQVSRAEIDPQDEHRQFYRLTPGKKMIVMLGGPCMNLLIFLILTVVLLTTIGLQHAKTTTTVGAVDKCVVPATSAAANRTTCPAGAKQTPAYGVLKQRDEFVSINGVKVTSWSQLTSLIQPNAGKQLTIVVRRAGALVTLHATPVPNRNYVNAAQTKTAVVGFLGFSPHQEVYLQTVPITGVPRQIGSEVHLAADAVGNYPSKIHNLWDTVFEGAKRDPAGAVGVVGIGRLSGDFASSHQISTEEKALTLLSLLASVNLILFFFNLLPLLPLDGGHVAGALVESAKRGRARLRARRRPVLDAHGHPVPRAPIFVDTAQMLPVMYAVASVLAVLTLLTLYADIVKPISLTGG